MQKLNKTTETYNHLLSIGFALVMFGFVVAQPAKPIFTEIMPTLIIATKSLVYIGITTVFCLSTVFVVNYAKRVLSFTTPQIKTEVIQSVSSTPKKIAATTKPMLPSGDLSNIPAIDPISLDSVLPDDVTLNNITIGIDESGMPLRTPLHRMMHTLVVGVSGWGKSTWMLSLLYQIAINKQKVGVVAVDTYGTELNFLYNWDKLEVPLAREENEAAQAFQYVFDQIDKRKSLFRQYPIVGNLHEYNAVTETPLSPLLLIVDEGTTLLSGNKQIAKQLATVVQTARKYGVYAVITGQSVTHRVMPTELRNNFSTRMCLYTPSSSSHVVLGDGCAADLKLAGEAMFMVPGRKLSKLLVPYISKQDFMNALTTGETTSSYDDIVVPDNDTVSQILALHEQGLSKNAIAQEVFGYCGGNAHYRVSEALR